MSDEMRADKQVFELLEKISEESIQIIFQMFSLAETGWITAYFFKTSSSDLLREASKCEVLDSNNNKVGVVPVPGIMALSHFLMEMKPVPDSEARFHLGPSQVPAKDIETLWKIRELMLTDLNERGKIAAETYAVIGTDPEGARKLITIFKDLQPKN
jgi:hypothetical protein